MTGRVWQAIAIAFLLIGSAFHGQGQQESSPTEPFARKRLSPAQRVAFGGVEAALAKVQFDTDGNPLLTAETEAALAGATDALPPNFTPEAAARVRFLILKGAPGSRGERLVRLFEDYFRYTEIARRELGSPTGADGLETELDRFEKTVALRKRHFGAVRASQLFGKQEALAAHILALRRLEADVNLSPTEREAKTRELKAAYETRFAD